MSKNVDERIVQMTFDGKDFEKNVEGAVRGLKNLEDATDSLAKNIGKTDLSKVTAQTEKLSVKWSLLQSVIGGFGANIGSKLADMAQGALKALNPFDNLAAGIQKVFGIIESKGWSRATKIDQAKFQLKGLGIAWDQVSDQVNYAVAGTAYGLDEAAAAAAKFAASGVKAGTDFKKGVTDDKAEVDALDRALGAVSGMAAVSGDSFAHMADIFADAAGAGKVSADTFNRISAQGVNAAATLAEAMGTTEAAVKDMASKGKISFQEFSDAMYNAYFKSAKDSNNSFDGALANMQAALGKIGADFAAPIRTNLIEPMNVLRVVINALKSTLVDSGIYEFFDELCQVAKNLFTTIFGYNDRVKDVLNNDELTKVSEKWKENFQFISNILKGLINIAKVVITTVGTVGKAIAKMLPEGIFGQLNDMSESFEKWTETLKPSKEVMQGLYMVIMTVVKVFSALFSIIKQIVAPFTKINSSGHSLLGTIGGLIIKGLYLTAVLLEWVANSGIIGKALGGIGTAIETLGGLIVGGFGVAADFFVNCFNKIKDAVSGISSPSEFIDIGKNAIQGFINGVVSVGGNAISTVITIFNDIVTAVKDLLGIHSPSLVFFAIAAYCLAGLRNGFTDSPELSQVLAVPGQIIGNLIDKFKTAFETVSNVISPVVSEVFTRLGEKISTDGANTIIDFFSRMGNGIKNYVTTFDAGKAATLAFIIAIAVAIKVFTNLGKKVTSTVGAITKSITGLTDATAGTVKKVGGFFDSMTYGVKKFTGQLGDEQRTKAQNFARTLMSFAISVAILAASLIALGKMPAEEIKQGGIALTALAGSLLLMSIILLAVGKNYNMFAKKTAKGADILKGNAISDLGKTILKFAMSMAVMAGACMLLVYALNQIDTTGGMDTIALKLTTIFILMGMLAAFAVLLSKTAPSLTKGSLFLLIFAGSIILLEKAFEKVPDMTDTLGDIEMLALALAGVAVILSKATASFGKAIREMAVAALSVALAMGVMVGVILLIDKYLPPEVLSKNLYTLTILAGFVVALVFALTIISTLSEDKNLPKMGGTLIAIGATMAIMGMIAKKLGELPIKQLIKGVGALLVFSVCIGLLMAASALTKDAKPVKFAIALGMIVVAMGIMAALAVVLGLVKVKQLIKGVGVMAAFTLMVMGLMFASKFTDKANIKAMTTMLVSVIALVGVMLVLSLINDWDSIRNALIALGSIMVMLGVTMALIGKGNFKVGTIIGMVAAMIAIGEIGVILYHLADKPWDSMLSAAAGISLVLLAYGNLLSTISKKTGIKVKKIFNFLLATLALFPIAAAMYALGEFDCGSMLGAGAGLAAAVIGVSIALGQISKVDGRRLNAKKIGQFILATLSLFPIAMAMAMLSRFDPGGIIASGIGLGLAIIAFTYALDQLQWIKVSKSQVKNFLEISLMMLPVGAALAAISAVAKDPWTIIAAAAGLGLAVAAITGVLYFMQNIKVTKAKTENFALACAALLPVGIALAAVAAQPLEGIGAGLAALVGAMFAVVGALALMNEIQVNLASVQAFAIASLSLIPIAMAMAIIAAYPWQNIAGAAGGLVAAALGLSTALMIMGNAKGALKQLASAGALIMAAMAMMVLAVAIKLYENIKWETIGKAGAALGGLFISLAILGAIGLVVLAGAGALLIASGALIVLAIALKMFENIDPNSMLTAGKALLGLGAIIIVVGLMAPLAYAGAAALALLGVAMIGIGAGMLVLSVALTIFIPALTQLTVLAPMLPTVALGLIAFAGGLVVFALACAVMTVGLPGLLGLSLLLPVLSIGLMLFIPALTMLVSLAPQFPVLTVGLISLTAGLMALSLGLMSLAMGSIGLMVGAIFIPMLATGLMSLAAVPDLTNVALNLVKMGAAGLIFATTAPGFMAASMSLTALAGSIMILCPAVMMFGATFTAVLTMIRTALQLFNRGVTKDAVTAGGNIAKGMVQGVAKGAPAVIKSGVKMMKGFVDGVKTTMGIHSPSKVMQQIGKMCGVGFDEGSNDADVWRGIGAKFKEKLNTYIVQPAKDLAEKLKTWFSGVGDSINSLGGEGGAVSGLTDKLTDMFNIEIPDYSKYLDKDAESAEDAAEANNDLADSLETAGGAAGSAKDKFQELADKIKGQIDIFAEFDAKTDMTADKLLANMKSQIDGVTNWANMMKTLGERGIDKGLLEYLGDLGPQGYQYVNAFVNMTADQLKTAGDYYKQALVLPGAAAKTVMGSYDEAGKWAAVGFKNGMNSVDAAEAAKNMGLDSLTKLKDALDIHSPSREMFKIGEFAIRGLANGIDFNSHIYLGAVHRMTSFFMNAVKEKINRTEGYDIGENFVKGLTQGIKDHEDDAKKAGKDLGDGVSKSTKDSLKEKSPSRIAYGIGKFFDFGLANGIKDYTGTVMDASDGMANDAVRSMSDAINAVTDIINSDMDTNPVIKPVLDLTDVQNGASSISSMFNDSIAMNAVNAARARFVPAYAMGNADAANASTDNSKAIYFTQNNYSPSALSTIDIYRQTRNQLAQVKGLVNET